MVVPDLTWAGNAMDFPSLCRAVVMWPGGRRQFSPYAVLSGSRAVVRQQWGCGLLPGGPQSPQNGARHSAGEGGDAGTEDPVQPRLWLNPLCCHLGNGPTSVVLLLCPWSPAGRKRQHLVVGV